MNYIGTELELFRDAKRWKAYWSSAVKPFVRGEVLDVGCGLGVNAELVWTGNVTHYTFLEPDGDLLSQAHEQLDDARLAKATFLNGGIEQVAQRSFNTILYLDVLEHIADDRSELEHAAALLATGGHLIVLAPAFPALFSPFDKAIGHHRRYTRRSLDSIRPAMLTKVRSQYLDSLGCLLSLGNRLVTRSTVPTKEQLAFWDRCVIPVSRVVDPMLCRSVGRSVLMIWHKPNMTPQR